MYHVSQTPTVLPWPTTQKAWTQFRFTRWPSMGTFSRLWCNMKIHRKIAVHDEELGRWTGLATFSFSKRSYSVQVFPFVSTRRRLHHSEYSVKRKERKCSCHLWATGCSTITFPRRNLHAGKWVDHWSIRAPVAVWANLAIEVEAYVTTTF